VVETGVGFLCGSGGCELVQIPLLDREKERRLAAAFQRCLREGSDMERDPEIWELLGWEGQLRLM